MPPGRYAGRSGTIAPTKSGAVRRCRTARSGRTAAGCARVKGTPFSLRARRSSPPARLAHRSGRRRDDPRAGVPQPQPSGEGVEIAAHTYTVREPLQPPGVTTAEHDVVRLESGTEIRDDFAHRLAPTAVAEALAAALADVVLEGAGVLVRHVTNLGRLDDPIDDERGPKPGTEPKKKHAAAAVAADRLHGRIVDHPHRPAERGRKVIADPPATEVVRFGNDARVIHQPRITDGHCLIAPGTEELAQAARHVSRRHLRAGVELLDRPARTDAELHMRSANVDDQDVPALRRPRTFPFCRHRAILLQIPRA